MANALEQRASAKHYSTAVSLIYVNDHASAIKELDKAIELSPREAAYWEKRAEAHIALRQFTPALCDGTQAQALHLASNSVPVDLNLLIARCMLAIGDGASAREHLRMTVLKDNSQNPVGAKLLESARKMADTWDEYREAKQGKKWEVASRALDDLISQCEGGETIELFVARTELAVISRDWETALSLARKAEQASPEALYTAAWVFFLTFNAPEALECMHSIQALDPQHQKTLILHSRLNLLCKRLLDLQTEQNSNGTTTQEYSEQLDLLIDFLGDREEDGRGGALRSTLLTVRAERSIQLGMPVGAFLDMDEARRIHAPMDSATEESSVMLRLQIEQQLAALTSAEDRSKDVLSKAVDERIRVTKAEALADAENFGKIGVGYFKKGDHGLARKYFTKAIACAPMTLVWWESRADTYLALKEFAKAVSDLEILQKFGATPSSSFFVKISRSYMATGDIMSAIQSIDAALGIEPENTSAQDIKKEALRMREHLNTLHSAQQHKQWTTVRHEVNELRSSCEGPGAPEWKTWLVRADIAERKWHDALSNLSLLDETSADHLTLRALVIFLADSDLDAMTKALNDALKMDPDHAPAKSLLRRSEDVMRLSQDAMSAFQAQDPSTALQKYNQGLALLGEEEAEGRGGLMRARFLSNQAFVFFQIGKYAEALSSANASLTLGPSRFYPLWTRARAQNALGRHDAAVEDYKAALAVAPDDNARRNTNNGLGVAKGDLQKCLQMNYYDLLGVSRRFSLGDLTKAYRNKCLLHHPDKSNGVDLIFKALQEAYAVLSDPQLRGLYDRRPH